VITLALIGTGGFIVTVFSYILGIIGMVSNWSAVSEALSGFFSSIF